MYAGDSRIKVRASSIVANKNTPRQIDKGARLWVSGIKVEPEPVVVPDCEEVGATPS